MNSKSSLIAAAALAALALASSVHAAPAANDPDAVKVRVSYADLNLKSEVGARALIARIRVAARTTCGGEPDSVNLGARATFTKCMTATVDRTLATLGDHMVTVLSSGQGGSASVVASR